jgi:hypothetical protein
MDGCSGGSGIGVVKDGMGVVGMCGIGLFDVGRLDRRQQKGGSSRMLAVEVQSSAGRYRPAPAGTVPNEQRVRPATASAASDQRLPV